MQTARTIIKTKEPVNLMRERHRLRGEKYIKQQTDLGWSMFYSQSPLYTIKDCKNEHQLRGFREAMNAFHWQMEEEASINYDQSTYWMI